ncbi:MAG: ASCH domain-containing protein [Bacillota bacterium]
MNKNRHALLISIRPEYAKKIFDGIKTVELRRVSPRVKKGDLVLVYVSSPTKAIVGSFKVTQVLTMQPDELWRHVEDLAGVSRKEFDDYFEGASMAVGIFLNSAQRLPIPIKLHHLKEKWPSFRPPQCYHYIKEWGLLNFLIQGYFKLA